MTGLLALSGTAQARLLREKQCSSVELVDAHIDRIQRVNPALNAVVGLMAESARRAAREADARIAAGAALSPVDGVPFSIKDSIESEGSVCTAGTWGYRAAPPSREDATLVARLRAAGAIPLARTNLPDLLFAFESDNLIHGRSNNPYNLQRTPGGSSGGESALIAACGSPFGLGSDAAGSVRLPAHFCGIASIKPTSGRFPRTGHVPPAAGWLEQIWQIGPMARWVEDLWTLMPLLTGPDGRDRTVVPAPYGDPAAVRLDALRVAFFTDNGVSAPTPETAETVRRAAAALASDGLLVEEHVPAGIEQSYELEMKLLGAAGSGPMREFLASIGSGRVHPLLKGWLAKLDRYNTTAAGFAAYWQQLDGFRDSMLHVLRRYDVQLSPVCAGPALPHGTSTDEENFPGFSYTMTHNVTGWPAAVVRCGESPEGLPINVQVAAAPWREDIALAVAARLEALLGGWKPPPLDL